MEYFLYFCRKIEEIMRKFRSFLSFLTGLTGLTGLAGLVCMEANAQVYQTKAIGQGITSVVVEYVEHKNQRLENGKAGDPKRICLFLPSNGVIDGTDPGNTLAVSFDELSHDIKQYAYTIEHLDSRRQKDDLQSIEYIRGFTREDIVDYATSINTQVHYTHYSFQFPNENMQIIASGNYLIRIYEIDGGEERTVATVVVPVVENLVTPTVHITPNTVKEISGHYQQVDIELNTKSIHMVNPDEVKLVVQQNGRLDNEVYAPYPTYIEASKLKWKDQKKLVFEGGNEYRHLDIYSTYFAGYNVDRIRYGEGEYHAFLMPDRINNGNYMHEYDHNGMCVINAERCYDIDTEAEYMYVHWWLPMENPIWDGGIYIGGDAFYGVMENGLNRMLYDNDRKGYYMVALLKQGGYDYQYWLKRKNEPSATVMQTEGSYWQTENEYTIWVFFRSASDRYDRLVGVTYSSSST